MMDTACDKCGQLGCPGCVSDARACLGCGDKGFLHAFNTDLVKHEIQRCDSCAIIADDDVAVRLHIATCGCDWEKRPTLDPDRTLENYDRYKKALEEIVVTFDESRRNCADHSPGMSRIARKALGLDG